MAQVREVAKQKMKDLNTDNLDAAARPSPARHARWAFRWWSEAMSNVGKRLKAAREGVDREKAYPIEEAVKVVKSRAKAKFDETVEISMNLGVDPKHADQMVRGVCNLPNGSGRTQRVAVFARGPKAEEAKAAGADVVGAEELVEQVQGAPSTSTAASPRLT